MVATAETLTQTLEQTSRRTDSLIYNVLYLHQHILDAQSGQFELQAEIDVLEQDLSELGEADIHKLGIKVSQDFDGMLGQYRSLGVGTVDNARTGRDAIDVSDLKNLFEYYRRDEEITEEEVILLPEVQKEMRTGKKKLMACPAPTDAEADLEAAIEFGYDDRTMFRIQELSTDGQTKNMYSFCVFDTHASAWASYLAARYEVDIEPTALAVMQFCNQQLPLMQGSVEEILTEFISGVADYLREDERTSLEQQLHGFLHDQAELEEQGLFYANEKLQFQKDLACSLGSWAKPSVLRAVSDVYQELNLDDKVKVSERFHGSNLYVDEYVAEVAIKIKTVTIDNRAGLSTLNERTVKRMASRIGLEATLEFAERERAIQQNPANEFMVRRNEQLVTESGVGCGGGCSVNVVDLFSSEGTIAREAGLQGKLYSSKELDKGSKCNCPPKRAKVISNGKNVVCVTCKTFQVNGKKGSLKKAA